MHQLRLFTRFPITEIIPVRLAFLLFAMVAVSAQASLTHRYSFIDGTANDCVGGVNGLLVNGATVSGGSLVLANDGTNANPATGQYVSLPANILKTPNFTVECWFTWNGGKPWQRILDMGNSVDGNGLGFLILSMNSSYRPFGQISINSWGNPADTDSVVGNRALPVGREHELTYVFSADSLQEQLYLDGTLFGTGTTHVDPSTANYTNFYIGRSQFLADPFFAGFIDELRTYDNALTSAQVLADWMAGPDFNPAQVATFQNTNLLFAATDLTTNGVFGLTNTAPNLMVSSVSPISAHQGSVSLVNTQVWARRYDGGSYDIAYKMAVDQKQNVIVTGSSSAFASADDFLTIKYASDGTPLWTNRYDGPAHLDDYVSCLAVDAAGNVYVAGSSEVSDSVWDVVTVKYATNGRLLWARRYNRYGTNYCGANGLVVDTLGNVFISADGIIKYDTQGNPIWTNYDVAGPIVIDKSGNVFVTGESNDAGIGFNYKTVEYASDGSAVWTNDYKLNSITVPTAIALDLDGDVIVTGDSLWTNHLYATIKYSNSGIPLWTNLFPGPNYQGGNVPLVVADGAGNVFMTGGTVGQDGTNAAFTTVKLSASGVPVWTNSFFETNYDNGEPAGTAVDSAGNFYFAGHSAGPEGTNVDFVTIKYAATGSAIWTNRYDGLIPDSEDWADDIAVDHAGNVYITGLSGGFHGIGDFATIKYSDYICYAPPTNFVGTDTFTFTVVDSFGNSATGTVTVAVLPTNLLLNASANRINALGMQLQVAGARGTNGVTIYASTNLVNWAPIYTNQPALGSAQFVDLAATNMQRRFYRAVQ